MSVAQDKITVFPGKGERKRRGGGGGGGTTQPGDWRADLIRNRDGRIESTVHNMMHILQHDEKLSGLFRLDQFANAVVLTRDPPWQGGTRTEFADLDGTELAAWLGRPDRYGMACRRDLVMDCVEAIARRSAFHPVREYLEGLTWDGTPRVARALVDLFGAEDRAYTRRAAECFFVSAVSRILWVDTRVSHNGAKVDFMLVLESQQGKGKTNAVLELFGPQWSMEMIEPPSSKDFYQALRGRWGVEIGEMDSFSKADVTKVKQAITSRFDTYRPSYGRVARSFRRECVFVGTTNETEYLRDSTGGRRFLPVRVTHADVAAVARARDQLWAEAVQMYRDGARWWELPAEAEAEQEARFVQDAWEEVVAEWLAGKRDRDKAYPPRLTMDLPKIPWVTTSEVLSWALGVEVAKQGRQEQMRIAPIMRRLGWEHERVQAGGTRTRRWVNAQGEDDDEPPF